MSQTLLGRPATPGPSKGSTVLPWSPLVKPATTTFVALSQVGNTKVSQLRPQHLYLDPGHYFGCSPQGCTWVLAKRLEHSFKNPNHYAEDGEDCRDCTRVRETRNAIALRIVHDKARALAADPEVGAPQLPRNYVLERPFKVKVPEDRQVAFLLPGKTSPVSTTRSPSPSRSISTSAHYHPAELELIPVDSAARLPKKRKRGQAELRTLQEADDEARRIVEQASPQDRAKARAERAEAWKLYIQELVYIEQNREEIRQLVANHGTAYSPTQPLVLSAPFVLPSPDPFIPKGSSHPPCKRVVHVTTHSSAQGQTRNVTTISIGTANGALRIPGSFVASPRTPPRANLQRRNRRLGPHSNRARRRRRHIAVGNRLFVADCLMGVRNLYSNAMGGLAWVKDESLAFARRFSSAVYDAAKTAQDLFSGEHVYVPVDHTGHTAVQNEDEERAARRRRLDNDDKVVDDDQQKWLPQAPQSLPLPGAFHTPEPMDIDTLEHMGVEEPLRSDRKLQQPLLNGSSRSPPFATQPSPEFALTKEARRAARSYRRSSLDGPRLSHEEPPQTVQSPSLAFPPPKPLYKDPRDFFDNDAAHSLPGMEDCHLPVNSAKLYELRRQREERERRAEEARQEALRKEEERRLAALRKAEEERQALLREQQRAEEEEYTRQLETLGLRKPTRFMITPLTDEWDKKVSSVAAGMKVKIHGPESVEMTKRDFERLIPDTKWLNDNGIQAALTALATSINDAAGIVIKSDTPKCVALTPFFFAGVLSQGPKNKKRMLKRTWGLTPENFFDVESIIVPINSGAHWTFILVRPQRREIAYVDSFQTNGERHMQKMEEVLQDFLGDQYIAEEWETVRFHVPEQSNSWDCGMFVITNAIFLTLGLDPSGYSQTDMPLQRRRIAAMILNGGFKGDFDLCGL